MGWITIVIAFLLVVGAGCLFVGLARAALLRHGILDRPNARSSHKTPTPRGGGIGLLAALLPAWILAGLYGMAGGAATLAASWYVPAGALALAAVSWIDDVRNLGALPRLLAQLAATIAVITFLPGPVFQGLLPPWLDAAAAVLVWVWFINLFNFMDGIDAISAVEAIAIGAGLFAVGVVASPAGAGAADHLQALFVAAAALGFLFWNRPPARIFLGDIGSVPLGYLLGWLLLLLAAAGHWQAALILPLYYLADATITLARRAARGEKVWQAHRSHFYQRAVRRGQSHAAVSLAVAAANVILILLAVVAAAAGPAASGAWLALAAAGLVVAALLVWMARSRPATREEPE